MGTLSDLKEVGEIIWDFIFSLFRGAFFIFIPVMFGYYFFGYMFLPDDWKLKYSRTYEVPVTNIAIEDKPTSCDWTRSPMGNKGCHYQAVVSVTRWSTSIKGKPIVSYDNGKTWDEFTVSEDTPKAALKRPSGFVQVGWEKIIDP